MNAKPTHSPARHGSLCARRFAPRAAMASWFALAAVSVPMLASSASAVTLPIVQEWYVPQPEAQILQDYKVLAADVSNTAETVIAITVPVAGTKIVYDHWEDGYEINIATPTQPTTQIWGDGNDANGKPPGFATDPSSLPTGALILLRNLVPLPRNSANILFDGRDYLGTTNAIVMTRASWMSNPGPVLGNSVEVRSVGDWGTSFVLPVGEDIIFPTPATNSMFEHCSAFIMAAANGTVVTIDLDGSGAGAPFTVTLNQGESYLVNAGIKTSATITSTKVIQVMEYYGDIGAGYESRGANVPPLNTWSNDYYAPIGTASDGDDTYIYLYNPDAAPITINYATKVGTGSFTVPAKGTYRFLMPQESAARFTSLDGKPFWGVGMVGAEPTANKVHDWGYSLVPRKFLSTEISVGWGAGSENGSQNGSPVWITPSANTIIYVDYNGDRAGPLTDSTGGKYDIAITAAELSVYRVYEPDKDQSSMRLYTLDGVQITGAWGQDPAVAGPGRPFLDLGNTLPNLPVLTLEKFSSRFTDNAPIGTSLSVGDVMEYTLILDNGSLFPVSAVSIVDVLPASLTYVANSTTRDGIAVADSPSGTAFPLDNGGVIVPLLVSKQSTVVKFRATINAAGTITNTALAPGFPGVTDTDTINVPTGGTGTTCTLKLTNSSGTEVNFAPGDPIYVTVTDADSNTSPTTAQTKVAVVQNASTGDIELITLTETGVNTGIFRNVTALASSTSLGLGQSDGTLNVQSGNTISANHLDTVFGDQCPDTASITSLGLVKQLYLDTDGTDNDASGDLDRVSPADVSPADTTTSKTSLVSPSAASVPFTTVGDNSWVVPAGVTSITVKAWGAGGGGGGGGSGSGSEGGAGGGAGYATNTLAVTPGETLTFPIGGGGGAGAITTTGTQVGTGGGGGGWSGVKRGSTTLLVAAGGAGGAGGDDSGSTDGGAGGAGGGLTGITGANAGIAASPGQGGTQSAGGAGGTVAGALGGNGSSLAGGIGGTGDGGGTTTGTAGVGGTGGGAAGGRANSVGRSGGGGGYFGGGGSSGAAAAGSTGGGGGGSGFAPSGTLTSGSGTAAGNNGDASYASGAGQGGTGGASGGNGQVGSAGRVVVSYAVLGGATWTQTPGFAEAFSMPAGGTLGVTNYVEVPSGTLTSPVDITATVKNGATTVATLTNPTATLISGGTQTIATGSTTSGSNTSVASGGTFSFSHTPGSGSNRLLLVSVGVGNTTSGDAAAPGTVTGVTFAGTAMTQVDVRSSGPIRNYIYSLVNPGSAAGNVVVTIGTKTSSVSASATTFTGVDQTTPLETAGGSTGSSQILSATVSATVGQLVYSSASADKDSTQNITVDTAGSQAALAEDDVTNWVHTASSTKPGGASVTVGYTLGNSEEWAVSAVPIRPASSSSIYQLDWSAALASAVNLTAGEALSLTTSNTGEADFSVLYDSSTYPSKITLPTTTVIHTDTVAVYDAPYPGGSIVTQLFPGQTVYVRTTVGDPFGAYDITSLPFLIDGPGTAGDVSTTLTDSNLVNTTAATKTYQYAWIPTSTEGVYTITATAKEGFENTITSAKSTVVTVSSQDTGTPSTTEFTTGDNGPHTLTYSGGETVYVRVTDLDQNTNPLVVETITVTIIGSGGDTEVVTLTETGPNTGIFTGGIPANSTSNPGPGTLFAALGSVPVVNYVDPNDPADTGNDTAIIPNVSPSVAVTKTLLSPADGQVIVGEAAQYRLRVTNNGNTVLNTVQVVDTFPSANLDYISATPAPDSTTSTTLTWSNVGPLTAGQSIDLIVNFTGKAVANPATNSVAVTTGGGPTANATAPIIVTNPALTVTKTLDPSTPGPVNKGDNVVFNIVVQNTGTTAISTLPLEDTYSTAYFDFVSATVAPDGVGSGSLLWNDVTGAGSLAVGASFTVSVTLEAKGAANPANNTAAVLFAVDANGDPVPPATSIAGVETRAATISGSVFADGGAPGFGSGDTVLPAVTVKLFTDPNGDGDPSDGVLVAVTTTDVSGYYEFLNLGTGTYVVVQEDILGYVSVDDTAGSDTDNRVPVNIATLTSFPNNNFLDSLVNPANFGAITGQVRNDTDADGSFADADSGLAGAVLTLFTDPNGDGDPSDGQPFGAPVTTTSSGNYSFSFLPPGNYVVVETNPSGFVSTADVFNPNDDRVPATVVANTTTTGKDFLDTDNTVVLGVIGNQIWADTNNNGLFDGGEAGINGVTVELYLSTQTPGVDAPYLTTTTSGGGLYAFSNVPPGSYVTYLPASNFAPGGALATAPLSSTLTAVTDNGVNNDDNGIQSTSGSAVRSPVITLIAGELENTVDFGFVPTTSLGAITGIVQADTDNNDTGDSPLAGVTLTLKDSSGNDIDSDPNTPGIQPTTTVTNASGNYTFANVPPGSYQVVETDPSGYASVTPNTVTPVAVTAGNTTSGVNFVDEQPGVISGFVLADTNNDNTGDTAIAGVTLTLKNSVGGDVDSDPVTAGIQPTFTVTAANGSYSFGALPPGSYQVVQTQPAGYLSVSDVDGGNLNTIGDVTLIGVTAGATTANQTFVEEQPGTITGIVQADTDNNDTGDSPLAGVTLTLKDSSGNDIDSDPNTAGIQPTTTVTNASGNYTFANVPPGSYQVVETDPSGYASVTPNTVTPVAVTAGNTTSGVNFVDEQPGVISGFVLADTNNDNTGDTAIAGVTLTLKNSVGGDVDSDPVTAGIQPTTTVTAADGSYSFGALPPGSYQVVQTQPAGYLSVSDVDGGNLNTIGDVALIGVTAGATTANQTFVEEQPGTITGIVQADTDNNDTGDSPLAGVTLTLKDSSGNDIDSDPNTAGIQPTLTVTDANGNYTFANVPPGSYQVVETDPSGYASVTPNTVTPVAVTAGNTTSGVNFVDEQPGVISGFVLADTNNDNTGDTAIAGVTLTLKNSVGGDVDSDPVTAGIQPTTTVTAADGSYSFGALPPGSYQVVQTQPAGYLSVSDVDGGNLNTIGDVTLIGVTAGATTANQTFVEEQPGTITGIVQADTDNNDTGDSPLAGVTLTLKDSSGNDIDSDPVTAGIQPTTTVTNASGNYTFANVPPGSYQVVETDPSGYASVTPNTVTPVAVTAGNTTSGVNFVDEQPGVISGFVLADTNNDNTGDTAIAGVTLTLKNSVGGDVDSDPNTAGIQPTLTVTAADGSYSFGGLPPGSYQVVQTQPAGYLSVNDVDGGNLNTIGDVTLIGVTAGATTANQTFVEEQPGTITGIVQADTDNNDTGDSPLAGVTLTLKDSSGNDIDSDPNTAGIQPTLTVTDANGNYTFANVPPGSYQVVETDPSGYASVTPNTVTPVAVTAGNTTSGVNFVDEQAATVSGHLYIDLNGDNNQDPGEPDLAGVDVKVTDSNGVTQTVTTDSSGNWTATVPPGSTSANVDETDPNYPTGYAQTEGEDPTVVIAVAGTNTSAGNDGYFLDLDADDDGIPDVVEIANNCDLDGDTDGDGVPDRLDLDSDGDGIFDMVEAGLGGLDSDKNGRVDSTQGNNGLADAVETAPDSGVINYTLPDSDGDGRPDHLDLDSDNDSISDVLEYGNGLLIDISNDGIADGAVNSDGIVPNAGTTAPVNPDGDGLPDYRDVDSDGDGVFDIVDNGFGSLDLNTVSLPAPDGIPNGRIDVIASGDCDGIADVLDPQDNVYGWFPEMGCIAWNLNSADDSDGDVFPIDQEYVFGADPQLGDHRVAGTTRRAGMTIAKNGTVGVTNGAPGGVDISWVRPQGRYDAVVTLYVSDDPRLAPNWTPVATLPEIVENGDTTQTLIWRNVHDIDGNAAVTRDRGFARLKVATPCNPAGSWTLVQGWCREFVTGKYQTYGLNFSSMPVFTGIVDTAAGSTLTTSTSGKNQNFATYLAGGSTCYVEFTDGPAEGHRLDVVSGGVNTFTLDLASVNNTIAALPEGLAASHFVVRRHDTLGGVYANGEWNKASSPGSADQVQFYNGIGYDTYFNRSTNVWVLQGSDVSISRNGLIIAPGTGMMVQHANPAETNELLAIGDLRYNDFRRPLKLNSNGLNFMDLGYPFDASPAMLGMVVANNFVRASSPGSATQIQNWVGDSAPNTTGWTTNFLRTSTEWATQGTLDPTTNSLLFQHCRSNFVLVRVDNLNWTHALPWLTAPWVQPAP